MPINQHPFEKLEVFSISLSEEACTHLTQKS